MRLATKGLRLDRLQIVRALWNAAILARQDRFQLGDNLGLENMFNPIGFAIDSTRRECRPQ